MLHLSPHEEVGLHRLRSEDVISLVLLQSPGLDAVTEPHGLRPELGVGPVVTLVTGVGDLLAQLQPPGTVGVLLLLRGEAEHAAREAGLMVHLVLQPAVLPLRDIGETSGRLVDQIVLDILGGFVKQSLGLEYMN